MGWTCSSDEPKLRTDFSGGNIVETENFKYQKGRR